MFFLNICFVNEHLISRGTRLKSLFDRNIKDLDEIVFVDRCFPFFVAICTAFYNCDQCRQMKAFHDTFVPGSKSFLFIHFSYTL